MDYVSQPSVFKIKKILRYARMYGPGRTYVKVQSQRHMRRHFQRLPPVGEPQSNQVVGLIGCGNYCFSNTAHFLTNRFGRVLGGCMDVDVEHAASLARYYRVPFYTRDADELLDHEQFHLIYIASNHASHAEYAIEALVRGKDVYIEKPHVVSEDQLDRLLAAMDASEGRVHLGLNRPGSRIGQIIRSHLAREEGPGVYNWFVAGHAIDPDHWYFHPQEGGRVLGNLCHWTDFLYVLAGEQGMPVEITPTRAAASDVNMAVTYRFRDESIGVISFSAKGHTFEGVMERFAAHKGNCLLTMDDFWRMTVQIVDKKRRYNSLFRDHGHRDNILRAYENSIRRLPYDRQAERMRIANTAVLFLKTKEALDRNQPMVARAYGTSVEAVADQLRQDTTLSDVAR